MSVGIVAFGTIAYFTTRRALVEAAEGRARAAAYSLAGRSAFGLREVARALTQAAADSAVIAALRSGTPSAGAKAALDRLPSDSLQTIALGLRSPDGTTVLSAGRSLPAAAFDESRPLDSAGFGRLVVRSDTIMYEVTAPVFDGGRLLGSVVRVRRLAVTPEALKTVVDLMGADGHVLFGNRDGSVWTDLNKPVDGPPSLESTRYRRDGQAFIVATQGISGTPFAFAAEFPVSSILAPMRVLVWDFVAIGVAIVGIGFLAGWWANARVTKPLTDLTVAAEAIATGDDPGFVAAAPGGDELGRLQQAFEVMAAAVTESRERLEEQVRERTRALEEAQQALIRKERMAALGQLAGTVAHELRNPLGVINNAVFYLQASLKDLPAKPRNHLEVIGREIRVAEKIITDILEFTREKQPNRVEISLNRLIAEQVGRVAVPSGVEIRLDLDPHVPEVRVDPQQIGQVLVNLLTNAVQAMDGSGGKITVRSRSNDGKVSLEVEDQGPGVPPADVERIFEPLYTTKPRGFGLGLSLSRSLAQAHGGDLGVAQAPTGGAVFVLKLPLSAT